MTKRPSLFIPKASPAEASTPAPAAPPAVEAVKPAVKVTARPPSREGKRVLSIYLSPEALKQLKQLALNQDATTQALGEEAVNLLFEKHRLNRIA